MNQIFLILLLYIIFGVIGPIIKRMQRLQQSPPKTTPPPTQPTPQQKAGATVEKYFTRLQDAFQQPSELPPAGQQAQSSLLSIPNESATPEDRGLELLPPPLLAKPRVSTTYQSSIARRKPTPPTQQDESLLGFGNRRRGYMQGILMAEILGPPVSKRPKR